MRWYRSSSGSCPSGRTLRQPGIRSLARRRSEATGSGRRARAVSRLPMIGSVHTASRLRRTPGRRSGRWCSQCRSARGSRSASSKYDPLIAISALAGSARISSGIRRSCGLSRRPASRYVGISVGRSATRNRRPPASYSLRISLSGLAAASPSGAGHCSAFPRDTTAWCGGRVPRASPRPGRRSRPLVPPFLASSASLIFRPSPRPLETPLTAHLRVPKAEAGANCEHQRNRASNCFAIQFRIPYGMRE